MRYPKIKNVYERDPVAKKLVDGHYSTAEFWFLSKCQWVFTEKLDGTNIRVMWDGYRVSFSGRTDNAQINPLLLRKLEETFSGPDNEELFENEYGKHPATLFGEGIGAKINGGGEYCDGHDIVLFGCVVSGRWRDPRCPAEIFGVRTVPTALIGTLDDGVEFVRKMPRSLFALRDRQMEGVIGQPEVPLFDREGDPVMVKIKARDFR